MDASQRPHWYQEAIIYEVHIKCFADSSGDGIGDFKGLSEKLGYLHDLGVTAIWLLPFYPSPLKDDGYDIADYTDVHTQYGSLDDFKLFLKEAHRLGLKVITELVINHTSDQHPWFQKARSSPAGSAEREFYVWSDTLERYKEARIIFQDFETSNWAWDPVAKSYYWHRFYSHQPDLNFENPQVQQAVFKALDFWLKLGVDGVRLDAIPYLYEEEGTTCENLPQTHVFLKKLREHVDSHFSNRMFLAEANQWPEDAAQYFGKGDECHMAFHFPVMPRLFMAIHLEDALPIVEIMQQTPEIPKGCQWALFLRNHDELTLEMVTDEERDYMFRVYAHDPKARINLGIRRRLAPLLQNDRRKIELMNVLLFSLGGTPVLYYGDEIGMGDNIYLGDRNGVRTPMQWSSDRNAGFSRCNPQALYLPPIIDPEYHYETVNVEAQQNNPYSLLWWTKQIISLRKRHHAFGLGSTRFLVPDNRKVLVFFREHDGENILIVANLSRFSQYVELDLSSYNGCHLIELFSGEQFPKIGELPYFLTLGPYGYYWFSILPEERKSLFQIEQNALEKSLPTLKIREEAHSLFSPSLREVLTQVLYNYLVSKSWFSSIKNQVERSRLKIRDVVSLPNGKYCCSHIVFLEVTLRNGVVKTYLFFVRFDPKDSFAPLEQQIVSVIVDKKNSQNILVDASYDKRVVESFAAFIHLKKQIKGEKGDLRGIDLKKLPLPQIKEESFQVACREPYAVVFPFENGLIRLYTQLDEAMAIDIEMRLFLEKNSEFNQFFPLLGYVEYYQRGKPPLAILEQIATHPIKFYALDSAIDSADRFLVESTLLQPSLQLKQSRFYSFLHEKSLEIPEEIYQLLGGYLQDVKKIAGMIARFHKAVSQAPKNTAFYPTSFTIFYQRSLYQTVRRRITACISYLKRVESLLPTHLSPLVLKILKNEEKLFQVIKRLYSEKFQAQRTRIHGNLSLENILFTGRDFVIANFEGDLDKSFSERVFKRSPLVDCAHLFQAFSSVPYFAFNRLIQRGQFSEKDYPFLQELGVQWSFWVQKHFFDCYLEETNGCDVLPKNENERHFLLKIYLLEALLESLLRERGEIGIKFEGVLYQLVEIVKTLTEEDHV